MNRVRLLLALATLMLASAFAVPAVADAAVNYFDQTTTVSKTMTAAQMDSKDWYSGVVTLSVSCPSGYRVTGGGYATTSGHDDARIYRFAATRNAPTGQGWRVDLKYDSAYGGDYLPNFVVYAICTR